MPRRPPSSAIGLLLTTVALSAGCRKTAPELPEAPAATVQTHGCDYIGRGPRCLLAATSTIVVWTDGTEPPPTLLVHETERPVRWTSVQGGLQGEVRVSPADRQLTLRTGAHVWSIAISPAPRTPLFDEVEAAVAAGEGARAERLLESIGAHQPLAERALAARWRGRIAWRASRPDTPSLRAAAAELAEQAGLLSLAVDEHLAAGHAHLHITGDLTQARSELDTARRLADSGYPRGAVLADELGAQLDLAVGDRRSATRGLERMAAGARRLDAEDIRWSAVILGAMNLTSMGRTERAAKALATIADSPMTRSSPCREALLLNHRAWSRLVAAELGAVIPPEGLRRDLDRALHLHRTTCRDRGVELDDLLSLALFELQRGDAAAARRHLATAEAADVTRLPRTALWYLDLAGRVALLDGLPRDALEAYQRLDGLARRTASADGTWRAAVGRARGLEALGDKAGAAEAYRRAEARLEDQSLAIALEDDRGAFLANHARYTRDQVSLLHEMGRPREVIATIRRARSRLLSHLDRDARLAHLDASERVRWSRAMTQMRKLRDQIDGEVESAWGLSKKRLAESEARRAALERTLERRLDEAVALTDPAEPSAGQAPKPGQLALGFHRRASGWLGFALTTTVARVQDLGTVDLEGDPEDIAAALLQPFATEIDGARQIRVLAAGGLEHIDLHALPWRGRRLVDSHEVVYALDLEARRPRAPSTRALVVTDPAGNLPKARAEGRTVQDRLRGRGLRVLHLRGAEATATAVRAALPGVRHFHYAGHAEAGEADGWQGALLLADDARLDPGGVLTLTEVPATAFLSGCETAQTEDRAVLSLGLAQAFVLAGTEEVIASVRPVDDATTEAIALRVYASGSGPLSGALRAAQRDLARTAPGVDWSAFRVIAP